MTHTYLGEAQTLADEQLVARVEALARSERGATVELIAHLVELRCGRHNRHEWGRASVRPLEWAALERANALER